MSMPVIVLPESIRTAVGDAASKDLVDLLNATARESTENTLELSEEKYERRLSDVKGELKAEISDVKGELKAEIAAVKGELKAEIAAVKGELKAEIAASKSELIRWMFVFWVGQVLATIGLLGFLYNK